MKMLLTVGLLVGTLSQVTAAPAKLEDTLTLPGSPPGPGRSFAIVLTGDGGWAELVREVAGGLASADIPCVGWDSRAYYWTRRTPDEASKALAQLIERFQMAWKRQRVVLVGYSRGADVLPFLVNRLPEAQRSCVDQIILLGPGHAVDFEFHLGDYLRETTSKTSLPVPGEIERLKGLPLLVLYGDRDEDSCAATISPDIGDMRSVRGDHHFGRDYARLGRMIREALDRPRARDTSIRGRDQRFMGSCL